MLMMVPIKKVGDRLKRLKALINTKHESDLLLLFCFWRLEL